MSTMSSFKSKENKQDERRYKNYMKKFCETLREHVVKINNFKKEKNEFIKKSCKNHMKMQKFVIFI